MAGQLPTELNARQRLFVEGVLLGKTNRAAAIDAGYKESGADVQSQKLLNMPMVKAKIDEGRAALDAKSLYTREQALLRLRHWAESGDGNISVRALTQMSKMGGWDAPTKVEVTSLTPDERKRRLAILLGVMQ